MFILGSNLDFINATRVRVLDLDTGKICVVSKSEVLCNDKYYDNLLGRVLPIMATVICHARDFAVSPNATYFKGYVYPTPNTCAPVYLQDVKSDRLMLLSGAILFTLKDGRLMAGERAGVYSGRGHFCDIHTYLLRDGNFY